MYRNHKLAVIEAKAWDKPFTEGAAQAKSYAAKMSIRFAYTTNGQGIYKIDMKRGKESEIASLSDPARTVGSHLCRSKRLARSLCRGAFRR